MPDHRFERAKAIVADALARPLESRAAFLDDVCGDDLGLRAELDSLLAHAVDTPSLLDTGGLAGAVSPAFADQFVLDSAAAVGETIGPYELLGIIGEGGMGTVYHARQREPFVRDVALKLIRDGFDSSRVVERFEAERRTLARLEHPGIARILDAGTDQHGRPYFVMELVRGVPVVEYADRKQLSIADRLTLFLDICRAVGYAHQRGVLHRDLKPGNLLVAEQDGLAMPKVIDFGIAKALEQTSDGRATITLDGHFVGTPDYMSPEQAGAGTGDPDTRSDVYSLGVVLYELLTGHRPLTLTGLRQHEIQQRLLTTEVRRPSSVVATSSRGVGPDDTTQLETISAARRATPSRLSRALAGDLDNIVLMSLRKEPDRRYAGVEQFAGDIRRYLDGHPVIARHDTWSYRGVKFARRHRTAVVVSAAALMGLVIFAGTMAWQRDRARDAEQRAAREAATARQVSAFLTGLFRQADPFVAQGKEPSARMLLDAGADRIARDLAGQPDVQSALLATMSQAYTGLRVPDRAVELAAESLRLARAQHGLRHPAVATSLVALAAAHAARSEHDRAMPLYREGLAMRRALLPADAPAILETTSLLALNLQTVSQFEEAEALYREALAITRRTRPEDHPDVTAALQHLGGVLHAQGKVTEARTALDDALARSRREASNPVLTADILSELAVLRKNQGLTAEAEPMYREALAIRERTFGDHPVTAQSHNNLGVFLRGVGQEERALEHLQRALAIHRKAFGESHIEVGIAHANVASVLKALGRVDEAERAFRSALASIASAMGERYWVYGQIEYNYGILLRDTGRPAAAAPVMVRGYEVVRDGLGAKSRRALTMVEGLAEIYDRLGQPDVAASYRRLLPASKDLKRE
jgi:serine/threonine protein kinase/tetratricopeptide (TPR) repeat protein